MVDWVVCEMRRNRAPPPSNISLYFSRVCCEGMVDLQKAERLIKSVRNFNPIFFRTLLLNYTHKISYSPLPFMMAVQFDDVNA